MLLVLTVFRYHASTHLFFFVCAPTSQIYSILSSPHSLLSIKLEIVILRMCDKFRMGIRSVISLRLKNWWTNFWTFNKVTWGLRIRLTSRKGTSHIMWAIPFMKLSVLQHGYKYRKLSMWFDPKKLQFRCTSCVKKCIFLYLFRTYVEVPYIVSVDILALWDTCILWTFFKR